MAVSNDQAASTSASNIIDTSIIAGSDQSPPRKSPHTIFASTPYAASRKVPADRHGELSIGDISDVDRLDDTQYE